MEILKKNSFLLTLTGVVLGLVYSIYVINGRIQTVLESKVVLEDQNAEILNIFSVDLVILLPALLGLFWFLRKSNYRDGITTLLFLVYGGVTLIGLMALLYANDALAAGLPILFITLPISIFIAFVLTVRIFKQPLK